jgi:hypothetical protein
MATKEQLKSYFASGQTVTEAHMSALIDACYNNGEHEEIHEVGVFAALQGEAITPITVTGQYEYINGTFSNTPIQGFEFVLIEDEPYIKYTGDISYYFEIDAHATVTINHNNATIFGAVKKNGTLVEESEMSVFVKTATESYNFSGTSVVLLEKNDTIQLVIKSDVAGNVTFRNLTATIRPFLHVTA